MTEWIYSQPGGNPAVPGRNEFWTSVDFVFKCGYRKKGLPQIFLPRGDIYSFSELGGGSEHIMMQKILIEISAFSRKAKVRPAQGAGQDMGISLNFVISIYFMDASSFVHWIVFRDKIWVLESEKTTTECFRNQAQQ